MSTSTQAHTITLLISCPDRPGIVAAISQFIFQHQGNICQSDQHSTDLHSGTFFMRISFAEDSFILSRAELVRAFTPIAERFGMHWSVHYSRERKRVGILVSKFDHCLIDLLWRWRSGELEMDISFVISNHPIWNRLYASMASHIIIFPSGESSASKTSGRCSNFCWARWIS